MKEFHSINFAPSSPRWTKAVFSAVARKVHRAQSAVSTLIGNLEAQVGVELFDRSGRYPKLTAQGAVLLTDARAIISGVDQMRARAKGISSGIEAELCVVIDVMFPLAVVTETAKSFRETFPRTPLRIFVEVLGSSYVPLLDGRASLGILGPLPAVASSLASERLAGIHVVMVAASDHPLASYSGTIPGAELRKHTQLVLTDPLGAVGRQGVLCLFAVHLAPCRPFRQKGFPAGGLGLWHHAVACDRT